MDNKCSSCGITNEELYPYDEQLLTYKGELICNGCHLEIIMAEEAEQNRQTCYDCKFREVEGGDSVPYGSTYVSTPEYEYCAHEITEDMTDEELEKLSEKARNKECPYWEA